LDDAAARQPADAESEVEGERPGRNGADGDLRLVAHPHHRALPELTLDVAECDVQCLFAVHLILSVSPPANALSVVSPDHPAALQRAPRTGLRPGADVKEKQRHRTERTGRSPARRAAAWAAPGSARRSRAAAIPGPRGGRPEAVRAGRG